MINHFAKITKAAILGCAAILACEANAITIGISNITEGGGGSRIAFSPGSDSFTFDNEVDVDPTAGVALRDFQITGGGSSLGLYGNIDGVFTIGAISISGGVQTASVSGSGTFSITDALGVVFSETLNWVDIYTFGTTGGVNAGASINLTGITYNGNNSDLLELKNATAGVATVSFQFIPGKTLQELTGQAGFPNTGTLATTYSGTVTSVPDNGTTAILLGMGLLGVGVISRRKAVAV